MSALVLRKPLPSSTLNRDGYRGVDGEGQATGTEGVPRARGLLSGITYHARGSTGTVATSGGPPDRLSPLQLHFLAFRAGDQDDIASDSSTGRPSR